MSTEIKTIIHPHMTSRGQVVHLEEVQELQAELNSALCHLAEREKEVAMLREALEG